MTKYWTVLVTAATATLLALFAPTPLARADIFEWGYINPANPSLGKQQSTTLAPDGAGAVVGIATDLAFRNLTKAYLIAANLSGEWGPCGEEGCSYYPADLSGANLSQADLSNAILKGTVLTGANLTDAEVRGADFYREQFLTPNDGWGGLTLAQLYSTASYKAQDLSGIRLGYNELAGANLTGQNLSYADFFATNLAGADTRGANFQFATLTSTETHNLIQSNGHIANLFLHGGTWVVRDYDGNPAASPPTGPLPIVVDQYLLISSTAGLKLLFDADAWDSTISFAPGIPVVFEGTLELTFAPNVNLAAQIGRTIDLFDWTGVTPTGAFTVVSPYAWDLTSLYTTGEVTLSILPAGDYSGNGTVGPEDYDVWKSNFGSTTFPVADGSNNGIVDAADFTIWRDNLGGTLGSGSGAAGYPLGASAASLSPAVPEPATFVLAALGLFGYASARRPRGAK